jgi:hypothetical protein
MPSARQVSASRKNVQRSNAAGREKRSFNLKRKRQPIISMDVLRALANSGLPPQADAYNARLKELLET